MQRVEQERHLTLRRVRGAGEKDESERKAEAHLENRALAVEQGT